MQKLVLVIHDVRSAHNVGAILRSAAGFGVNEVVCSGYTPYPKIKDDPRLTHETTKTDRQIAKTALGAEKIIACRHIDDLEKFIAEMKQRNYLIIALEQDSRSRPLDGLQLDKSAILIVGNEVSGLGSEVLERADVIAEIPMPGQKESLNVAVAAGIALYELTDKH